MGFDIALTWEQATDDPLRRNRWLADELLATFPGLSEFPLNPEWLAESFEVPVSEVWNHWNQIELNSSDDMLGWKIELWLDRAYVDLPSNPRAGCELALAAIEPLLKELELRGLKVVDPDGLLREYQAQKSRVLRVASIVWANNNSGEEADHVVE